MMLDGLHAKRRGDVRFAGTRPPDQHDIVGGLDKVTPVSCLIMASLTSLLAKSKASGVPRPFFCLDAKYAR